MDKIRTAVVGAGRMGALHAKIYYKLPQSRLVGIVDTNVKKAKQIARKYKTSFFHDCADIIEKVDAVTIAAPTVHHLDLARLFITKRIPVLIEKPLAVDTAQAREIVELAGRYDTVVAVGHSERCNPVVQAIKRFDIEPKFIQADRISPYPFRSADVGVVLDVMIHDIDIVLSMAASQIKKVDAVGLSVIDEKEDICNARLFFKNGCIANITASRVALKTERKLRVFSRQAYLSVDFLKRKGTIIKATGNINVVEKIRQLKKGGKFDLLKTDWTDLLRVERLEIDDIEPLRLEQESFLRCAVDRQSRPEVSAVEGLEAMECAGKILSSIEKHTLVT